MTDERPDRTLVDLDAMTEHEERILSSVEQIECLDRHHDECEGDVEYRMPLSGTGRSFPRCAKHWEQRLERQHEIDERYPTHPPADWSPLDAGEAWNEID